MFVFPVPRSVEYPAWDWRESRDFDELNHILQESKKLGKALESLSRSEWTAAQQSARLHHTEQRLMHLNVQN